MVKIMTPNTCRLCLNDKGSVSVFSSEKDVQETYADIIMKCSSVKVVTQFGG